MSPGVAHIRLSAAQVLLRLDLSGACGLKTFAASFHQLSLPQQRFVPRKQQQQLGFSVTTAVSRELVHHALRWLCVGVPGPGERIILRPQ